MARTPTTEEVLVIGIDFGTTYSGVAWAYSRQPENIEVITNWESELTHCSDEEKSPTLLKCGKYGEQDEWGYTVTSAKDAFRWFKLLLLNEKDVDPVIYNCSEFREARSVRDASGKSAVEIVSRYLQLLWNHAINDIQIAIGEDLMVKCRFNVVITLPAIWPHYAQQRMEQAAEMAGILAKRPCGTTLLRFISEPEAAALSTLGDQANKSTVEVDDNFVICDAGGGTVDLISYRVSEKTPFTLKESVKGDGGLCGGIFLDKNFLELVKSTTGGSWHNVSKKQELKFMNDSWEHGIKRQFRGRPRTWIVDTPDSVKKPQSQKRSKGLSLHTNEILKVFDPIIRKIEALVKSQSLAILSKYGKQPKYVILVGGFGRNPYLRDCLDKSVDAGTKVLQSQGTKPWVAICRGAVIHGLASLHLPQPLNIKVESRVARLSYGVVFSELYDPERHSIQDMNFDSTEHVWKANNQMEWFLKQGQDLSKSSRVRRRYHRNYTGTVEEIEHWFYITASRNPPSRREDCVSRLCSVKWNTKVDSGKLPRHFNSLGVPYRVLNFEIEMTCDGRSIDFTVYYKGRAVANHNVVVEYE
ncbi:hypothetical protein C2857_005373 [Epichloe festucae Fl1]|uniref:Uncharacterized protein n=1 Tax=Epichloe festucae (strain Fl1) TaxID=877507 RepID=A0A7S9KSQ8_EPIFF|nr:hypothetical protein C2857_005373 [Epichloe festucae Fl1]